MKIFYNFIKKIVSFWHSHVIIPYYKNQFGSAGQDVCIGQHFTFDGLKNFYFGNHISIGANSTIYSTKAKLQIHDYVLTGPGLTIITGDHRTDIPGKYIYEITDAEKSPKNDLDVIIEKDVWIGANVTILKGVIVGIGSIIAAGSIVNKNIEPYSIYAGVPAKKIGDRFLSEQLIIHKKLISERNESD
jgi:acetyltransferase-like isoleucine patch superfamily enzyme